MSPHLTREFGGGLSTAVVGQSVSIAQGCDVTYDAARLGQFGERRLHAGDRNLADSTQGGYRILASGFHHREDFFSIALGVGCVFGHFKGKRSKKVLIDFVRTLERYPSLRNSRFASRMVDDDLHLLDIAPS
uniref:hypothetical protein n=1 Tax=Burkholderia diffusa TaxID=488732 RepID=UPI001CC5815D|nr:hypothetical protein [Burkholderia diffusa]